jgi:hypothetical protein
MVKSSGKEDVAGLKSFGQAAIAKIESSSESISAFSLKQSYKGEAQKLMDNLDGGFGERLAAGEEFSGIKNLKETYNSLVEEAKKSIKVM